MTATIKNVKKNATNPTRIITELNAMFRTIDSAAKEVIIVPILPVNKHPNFCRKQPINKPHEPLHEPKNTVPKIYSKTSAAKPKAIQIAVTINGMLPRENSIPIITPTIIPTMVPTNLQPPHTQLLLLFVFIFIILPLTYYTNTNRNVKKLQRCIQLDN
jgi:hypothetical protein